MTQTVLLIDDDPDTRIYISTVLLRAGYQLLTAGDGQEGWRLIKENHPDLILLDMMMPRQSGWQLLKDLRQAPEFMDIPVIVISGVSRMTGTDPEKYLTGPDRVETARPDYFIEKPIKPDFLLRTIKQVLPA